MKTAFNVEDLIEPSANKQDGKAPEPAQPRSLPFIDMTKWDTEPVPEQAWAVRDRIPLLQVTLFSGEGAAGKSTEQLHLSAAHALARDFLGSLPEPGPAIFIDAEDDQGVLHRRLAAIAKHYGVTFADMITGGLHLISLSGDEAVLAAPNRSGIIEPTARYKQLLQACGDIKPKMIGIASSANVFAGNENDRSQVQQFVGLLTRLAIVSNGAVNLISHPSLSGITNETGCSGSTQWHNAVRARMYLRGVKPEAGEQRDNDLREMMFMKNNYGPVSERIVLKYRDGLFLPLPGVASLDKAALEATAESVFVDLLRRLARENRFVSDKTGRSYAPALFAREQEATKLHLSSKALEGAMRRLFQTGTIWNEPCGKPSRPSFRIAIK